MRDITQRLLDHPSLGPMVVHHRRVPARRARYGNPASPLPARLARALREKGIERLWDHQARAIDLARGGANVLAVTPTASGKTLVFALPVLETLCDGSGARALFLYPTKALAQDQIASLRALAAATGSIRPPTFEIYDGDTPDHRRRKIRKDPPDVLLTNPDMLHAGILAHHTEWERYIAGLRWIVLDEIHVYRGLFGAHVHHILARLSRLCAGYGSCPRFLATSATIGNPAEFSATLTGEPFEVVEASGAPRSARHVVFLNPVGVSPYTTAVRVIAETAGAGLRTIAFTKARRVTELLHTWITQQAPELRRRVAPYRAGYLPEERRRIEERLFRGDLLAVLSTSALELGIDVGRLDVCVLVGYPGSKISTWQRIGRVGRQGRDALVVLVALPDALDQFVVAHPDSFFGHDFERAVLDPWNPIVAAQHLVCASAERPLTVDEVDARGGSARRIVGDLEERGGLARDREGTAWHAFRRRPHRDVNPRSAGEPYSILEAPTGRLLGTVDGVRVHHECHEGAIYLHGGQSFRVVQLDTDARRVLAEPARVDYYTAVLGEKETEILEVLESCKIGRFDSSLGRLKVTVRIHGYQKKRLFGGEPISSHRLETPPLVFETVGFWVSMPKGWAGAFQERDLHFMGGLHATEHAAIGLFPLLAIADRGDVGGISYTGHPQTGGPAVFLYDGVPGGAGLAEQGYRDLEGLLRRTLEHVAACPCDDGCPACIQSPRCGNGNKPLDKRACLLVLSALVGDETVVEVDTVEETRNLPVPRDTTGRRHGIVRAPTAAAQEVPSRPISGEPPPAARDMLEEGRILVLDLETQRSAEEVGGWGNAARMGLALAVVWESSTGRFRTYREEEVERLLLDLALADLVVGFNIDRFDMAVLSGYTDRDLGKIRTLDLLSEIHRRLGFRVSLGHLAEVNLGERKSADGLQSLRWWREGRIDRIETYCRQDVDVTRRLWETGRERGYLLYRDRAGRELRVPVSW